MLRYMWQRWLVCAHLDDTVRVGLEDSQNDTKKTADFSRGSLTRDESPAALGTELKLPPWLEDERERLEERLPEIRAPGTVEH